MDEKVKEEMHKKYLEVHMMSQQVKQVQQQLQTMDLQIEELERTAENIESLEKVEDGSEIFVTVTPGVFVKAEIKDSKNLLVNVGAGTGVEKPVTDTVALVKEQISEITKYRDQVEQQLGVLMNKNKEMEQEMQGLAENV